MKSLCLVCDESWTMTLSYLNDNNFYSFGMFWCFFFVLFSLRSPPHFSCSFIESEPDFDFIAEECASIRFSIWFYSFWLRHNKTRTTESQRKNLWYKWNAHQHTHTHTYKEREIETQSQNLIRCLSISFSFELSIHSAVKIWTKTRTAKSSRNGKKKS